MKIGSKLKQIRKERNLTLETVAKSIGITKGALSQYENDIHDPSYRVLKSLLDFYCVNVNAFILTGKEYLDISFYSDIGKAKALALHDDELQKLNNKN